MRIPSTDLRSIANSRLEEAEILYKHQKFDGAVYLCGYSVELMLKARICDALKWAGFPQQDKDIVGGGVKYFLDHNLSKLLHLTGKEDEIKTVKCFKEWNLVVNWTPEYRYRKVGSTSQTDAQNIIIAAKKLVGEI